MRRQPGDALGIIRLTDTPLRASSCLAIAGCVQVTTTVVPIQDEAPEDASPGASGLSEALECLLRLLRGPEGLLDGLDGVLRRLDGVLLPF